jgi:D-3-phosphoglycerate dehydrogenase
VNHRVLVTDHPFPSLEVERRVLEPLGVELTVAPSPDEETLAELAREATALLVCYAKVTPMVVAAAAEGSCRIFARYGIGVDNIDVDAATRAEIVVTNVPDYCVDEVADHAMALLLAAARGVAAVMVEVREGGWLPPLGELGIRRIRGRRLALVGVGRIGRGVVERARAFGLEVVGYDPYLHEDVSGLERVETLEAAIEEADFISLHAPLTSETTHLIGERTLGVLRRAPVIVNTSRGRLVDTQALVQALDDGRVTAAALDVTDPEPLPPEHPLRRHPRVILTAHIAYYSEESQDDLQRRAAEEVARALRGEPARCPVNAVPHAAPVEVANESS